jgi:hypothetical protein
VRNRLTENARVGVALAAVPHVLLFAWMLLLIWVSSGTDRAYVAFLGVAEIFVLPVALIIALVVWFVRPIRRWAVPMAVTSVAGALLVFGFGMLVATVTTRG